MEENIPNKGQNPIVLNTLSKAEDSLFSSSNKDLFIFKKTEKICGAIHLLTKFFPEDEPIRKSLRGKSIEAISLSLSFINSNDLSPILSTYTAKLIEIKSLLQISLYGGFISDPNHNILISEIDNLLANVDSKKNTTFPITASFLEVNFPSPQVESKGHIKGHSIGQDSKMSFYSHTAVDTDRTKKILSLLKDEKVLTIKDFSHSIKGCSEKTLQRELQRLVSLGKVLKTGERRWSRYSLK